MKTIALLLNFSTDKKINTLKHKMKKREKTRKRQPIIVKWDHENTHGINVNVTYPQCQAPIRQMKGQQDLYSSQGLGILRNYSLTANWNSCDKKKTFDSPVIYSGAFIGSVNKFLISTEWVNAYYLPSIPITFLGIY